MNPSISDPDASGTVVLSSKTIETAANQLSQTCLAKLMKQGLIADAHMSLLMADTDKIHPMYPIHPSQKDNWLRPKSAPRTSW